MGAKYYYGGGVHFILLGKTLPLPYWAILYSQTPQLRIFQNYKDEGSY